MNKYFSFFLVFKKIKNRKPYIIGFLEVALDMPTFKDVIDALEFMNLSYEEQKGYIRERSLKHERGGMCTSYNGAYLASCLRHSAQIPLRGTSDTLGAVSKITI